MGASHVWQLAGFPELLAIAAVPLALGLLRHPHALKVEPLHCAVWVVARHHLSKADPPTVAVHRLCRVQHPSSARIRSLQRRQPRPCMSHYRRMSHEKL